MKGGAEKSVPRTRDEIRAQIKAYQASPSPTQRIPLLALGDLLLDQHNDAVGAVEAYLFACDRDPIAKWEFGERLLVAIDARRIAGSELETVVRAISTQRESVIVPDLWRGIARSALNLEDLALAKSVLILIMPQGDPELLHELAEMAREGGKAWASLDALDALGARVDAGTYSPGMGFYLKRGHAQLEAGAVAAAVASYARAQAANPEAKLHLGGHLLTSLDRLNLNAEQLRLLVVELDSADCLVPDLRPRFLLALIESSRSHENLLAADQLVRLIPRRNLIEMADQALGVAKHAVAVFCYEEAIKKEPQDVLTRLQIGITHYLANDHQAAEAHFSTLMTLQEAERQRWGVDKMPVRVMHWTWIQAFGHITCIDTYIKAMKLGWLPDHTTYLGFDRTNPPAGWRLLTYFSKYLEIVGAAGDSGPAIDRMIFGSDDQGLNAYQKDIRRASLMNFFWALPNNEGRMRYFGNIGSDVQRAWKAEGREPLIKIEDDERARFRTVMEQSVGLPRDAWFVLLHVRESSFKPGWETHHQYTRNAVIDTYDRAIEHIVSQGGWVIRGGDPSMRRLPPRKNVIDYATSPMRSPELDVLLCAECKFFLGTNSGFSLAPPLFGKRCLLTNWSPLANPNWYPDDIFVPKLVRERKTGRYLSIQEMYQSKAGWSQFSRDFQTDWEKIDSSSEDILLAVKEMMNELDNGVRRSDEALRREARYHEIVERNAGYIGSRLSDGFLERNAFLLDESGRTPGAGEAAPAGTGLRQIKGAPSAQASHDRSSNGAPRSNAT